MVYLKNINRTWKLNLSGLWEHSRMPGTSKEYAALDKAEEELEECLIEVRKLKSHFNEMKVERKGLTEESKKKTIAALIVEMGDIFVDVFLALPVIIPSIKLFKVDQRIGQKLQVYLNVLHQKIFRDSVAQMDTSVLAKREPFKAGRFHLVVARLPTLIQEDIKCFDDSVIIITRKKPRVPCSPQGGVGITH
jgi:hypothetical protein